MIRTLFISMLLIINVSPQEMDATKFGIDTSSNQIPQGLALNQTAPQFKGFDQNGKEFSLSAGLEQKPVVLIFYRGQWCPICIPYLKQFQDSLKLIEKRGVKRGGLRCNVKIPS